MITNPELIESTPLEEECDFASMFAANERRVTSGGIQEGMIVKIDPEFTLIAVNGAKQEGRLSTAEITDDDGKLLFKEGDKIEVYTTFFNERPNISYKKVIKMKNIEAKIQALQGDYQDKIVECKIIKKNRGGYIVEFDGAEAFLPRFASALKEDNKNIGKTFKVCITDIKPEEQTIYVSRKRFLDLDRSGREERVKKLLEGDNVREGVISKITPFGIFVEIDGIEGLAHYTELSHRGPINPTTLFKVGEKTLVKILAYDAEKHRLSLSVKGASEDPWKEIESQLDLGDQIKVVVSNIENYGAFVDLGNGAEGFLHISEISWNKNLKHPADILTQGQEINVEIIEMNSQNKRLRVSLKRLLPKPFTNFKNTHQVGDVVEGKIAKIADFGLFVNLGEVDGLIHNEDICWAREKTSKDFKAGENVQAKIIKIDQDKEKISLSIKALTESPIKLFAKTHQVDDQVEGTILAIKDFGVFIDLGDKVEALIRDEDLHPLKKEELQVGDKIACAIAFIDKNYDKIRASVRKLERIKELQHLKDYNEDTKMTLGDKIKL
ncbi:30S ribosomal protein S1 [Helicobacter enhydrae]|uniref:30S ribosomal protein S1 n=1 Tax=Helicobacter enhydrae TaxID=222136 RepID=A0A1B1U4W4_9HELI|nr:30S ribosomal protein S1 [Helicobacter enhydrae]ANV97796.1 30S ribosomal protein S1 [Helicobacter enhydrae]